MSLRERIRQTVVRDGPAYTVIALALVAQVLIAVAPMTYLVSSVLPDDAFYYFEIARHIATGQGSTFDGFHPTNGYHPLWMLVLLPIFSLFSGGVGDPAPIHVALIIAVALNVVTAVALLDLLRRVVQRPMIRAFALGLWALNPFVLFETMNGLETAIAMALFALFVRSVVRLYEHDSRAGRVGTGVLAGLMILARLDLAIYFAAFLIGELFRFGIRIGLRRAIPMGLIGTAICVPWFVWNVTMFGMLFTSASNGASLINRTLVAVDNGPGVLMQLKGAVYLLLYHGAAVLERTGAPLLYAALTGALCVLATRVAEVRATLRQHRTLIAVFAIGFLALFVANAGIRFVGRAWYFISLNLLLAVAAGAVLAAAVQRAHERLVVGVLTVLTLTSFALGWRASLRDQFANQSAMLAMATWINETKPPTVRVGVFNAGVQGYFVQGTVVNLDGLVNNAAYEAIRDRRLWAYVQNAGIEYVSDFPVYLTYRHRPFMGVADPLQDLTPQHVVTVPGASDSAEPLTFYQLTAAPKTR